MTPRFYALDPDSTAVIEDDASTGKPIELMIDLDAGLTRFQLLNALVTITDYISRNQPAASPSGAAVETTPPPAEPKS